MAISRMQQPRQQYGLGKLVKKAVRGVKKVVKSPLGKAAILGGIGMIPFGGFGAAAGTKASLFSRLGGALGAGGKFSTLGDIFRVGGKSGAGFSIPRILAGGLAGTAIAAPFFMGGDDEEEEDVEVMDIAGIRNRVKDFYRTGANAGEFNFLPQKQFVQPNFYAASGGRAGYQDGMMVEDEEEEFVRSRAGMSRRMPKTFLNMGGGAGQAQAEQMLMMEYVKYKNKGGTLSFEQFVKAVMQQAEPEGAGMEQPQPVMMAANGGPVPGSEVAGYTTPAGYNKFDYRTGGVPVRVGKQEGGIMESEAAEMIDMGGMEKDFRNEGGFVAMGGKERADDVPARLSKNEFVFTADAVRNAGGGDIDKGAEVMENLMNNLEAGGQVSEDSQGLEGAQRMYEQQQMLQSRMI